VTDDAIAALLEAAEGGVSFGRLTAAREGDTYTFEVPGTALSGLTESEARAAMARHRECVTEWHFWEHVAPTAPARFAFLRWIERAEQRTLATRRDALADGVTRTWGQLELRAKLAEAGRRTYSVRHVADSGVRVEDLAVHTDPRDARELRARDAAGDERPLPAAPTLAPGWVVVDLDATELPVAVEGVYPGSVADWHREREGDLAVTHWGDLSHGSGDGEVPEELPREGVEALAAACCVDGECTRRRRWDAAPGADLAAPRGEGRVPCPAPCSLVRAVAGRVAAAERESVRTYEVELTPTEKAQVERILGAVSNGEEVAAGDLEDPANHYRARYLRARRLANGDLPTRDPET